MSTASNAIDRTWADIALVETNSRLKRGELFLRLRALYSGTSADVRRQGRIGTFEKEIDKRGYKVRTVYELISDYEAHQTNAPSSSAKRKARRARRGDANPVSSFAALLPFEALQAAYRTAAKLFHPDLGGDSEQMQGLNASWVQVEKHFESEGETLHKEAAAR
jgi:hypothetical protein